MISDLRGQGSLNHKGESKDKNRNMRSIKGEEVI